MALAGIAHPDRFIAALKQDGWNVVDAITFADHHRYSRRDITRVAERVQSSGAEAVLTTDKDAVRLEAIDHIPFALYRVPLTVAFDPPDVLFASAAAVLS